MPGALRGSPRASPNAALPSRRARSSVWSAPDPELDCRPAEVRTDVGRLPRGLHQPATRPSRRALGAPLRMTHVFDGIKIERHPAEAAKRPSGRTDKRPPGRTGNWIAASFGARAH